MERWQGRVAVVTGASEGIGEAIVRALAAQGMKVVALARREQLLKALEKELTNYNFTVKSHVCDVTDDTQVNETFNWIEKVVGPISVLVNNAAIFKLSPICNLEVGDMKSIIDTNLTGLLHTTIYGLRSMKNNKILDGHIININSVLGHRELPIRGVSMYSATKHAVTVINTALKTEFMEENAKLRVTSISPGLVNTSMSDWYMKNHKEAVCLEAKDVANTVIYALSAPPHVNITELTLEPV